jgi:hypothetical protein
MSKYTMGIDLSTLSDEEIIDLLPKAQADAEIARRAGVAPGTIPMTPELNKIIEDIGEENLPKKLLKTIKSLRNPTEKDGVFGTPFVEQDPQKQADTLYDKSTDLIDEYGTTPEDPNIGRVINYLRKMQMTAGSGKQLSSSDFLINQAEKLGLINPEFQMGPQLAFLGFGGYNPFGTPFITSDVQPAQSGIFSNITQMTKDMVGQDPVQTAEQAAGQTPTQRAIRQQQEETQQKIIDEVKESGGGGGPAGMVGTPSGPGQTGGPAGMGFAPSNNPTGFGSNIRIGKANGGIVSLFGRF